MKHLHMFLLLSVAVFTDASSEREVDKCYAVNTCTRTNTQTEKNVAAELCSLLNSHPTNCTSFSSGGSKRSRRAAPSWTDPVDLPLGSIIIHCNSPVCCTPKKTLRPPLNLYYNLCRECVHLVRLPNGYVPREFNHVTCQDSSFYETCLLGEGACTTNMVTRSFTNDLGIEIAIKYGQSCSCEIRKDSILALFIV